VKIGVVIHRYGAEVAGGSEAHARGLVSGLRGRHDVEVLTTCALDYVSWRNHYPPGTAFVDGVAVTRYPNAGERHEKRFAAISDLVFHDAHTPDDEERWLRENGPLSPALIDAVGARRDLDALIVYSYRYFSASAALRAAGGRALLAPTAEEDPAIRLGIFRDIVPRAAGYLYLTPEEQALVEESFPGARGKPSAVIGSGLDVLTPDARERAAFALPTDGPYALYAGRIDRNKGVDTLFRYYGWLVETWPECPTLVLAGHQVLDIPAHPKVRYLGYVTAAQKSALIDGAAVVVMPSPYESLSMIALEAWALGKPVLASARCRVLVGQCERSGGGLYYRDFAEFERMLRRLVADRDLARALGASAREYVRAQYSWEIAASRADDLLRRVFGNGAGR
jgi:glycosyltransferase involved in cell wall biosynthesis